MSSTKLNGSSSTNAAASSSSSSTSPQSSSRRSYSKVLTPKTCNPHVLNVEYAVRGALSNKANDYAAILAQGKGKEKGLPFDSIVTANIGNPQQQPFLAQKPLTFWRQVAALTEYPPLLEDDAISSHFPQDAKDRAKAILEDVGSVGAYSHSKGAQSIRQHVKEYIEKRDGGHASDAEMIYLTSGASGGVGLLMSILISGPEVGVMIPIPQYPLYSATLSFYNAQPVRYELNAEDDWSIDVSAMGRAVDEARSKGTDVRALVVINPGNPTGSCLSVENIQDIIKLAHDKNLLIMADEVYQANIFQPSERPFYSFKKVLKDLGGDISKDVELISFHSISKGVSGECGRRGGYFELCNLSPEVESQIYKMASVNLCPSIQGQIGVDLLVKPPQKGEPSYDLYQSEIDSIHKTLHSRSLAISHKLNELPGIQCPDAHGALYLFPCITSLPPKAIQAAEKEGKDLDTWYCFQLLEKTGICCVPGNGFGKHPIIPKESGDGGGDGDVKFWFRTTILAKETEAFVDRFEKFHLGLLEEYK